MTRRQRADLTWFEAALQEYRATEDQERLEAAVRKRLEAAEAREPVGFWSTWRHVKTGNLYRMIGHATRESDLAPLVIYQRVDDLRMWARPASEFYDGRFQEVLEGREPKPPRARPSIFGTPQEVRSYLDDGDLF